MLSDFPALTTLWGWLPSSFCFWGLLHGCSRTVLDLYVLLVTEHLDADR